MKKTAVSFFRTNAVRKLLLITCTETVRMIGGKKKTASVTDGLLAGLIFDTDITSLRVIEVFSPVHDSNDLPMPKLLLF